ncbi:MAG: SUMF1/EgtB/PvdO family nonheme iron enzyme [Myxococcales bacterium]|nr:SUMF1/EgtB/PvdO family nonheme iron enzyme [Myxococcales bacterium]
MPLRTPHRIDPKWTPPETFDEYRLLCPLSEGGMGKVYLGHDSLLDRPVAIKFIHAIGGDDNGAHVREQILNEARAAARLQHPNVVTIYRVSEIDAHPIIISEFVRGKNLDAVEKPMPWQKVLDIGLGVARGLAAAHRRGVLHLDIKPGNVIVQNDGEVKLLDFGLAKLLDLGIGWGGAELNSDEIRRSSAATPEVVAPTMDFSGDQAALLLASAPLATLARGVAIDERTAQGDTSGKVSLNPSQPEIPSSVRADYDALIRSKGLSSKPIPAKKTPKPATAAAPSEANSSDLLPVAGDSSDSGAVTSELPRVGMAATPPAGMRPMPSGMLSSLAWSLPEVSSANRIAGTPLYMAPEIWRGEPGTRRADIYATGVLLYELCTGAPPFADVSLQDLPQIVNQRDATPLYSVAPAVDPRLAAIIDRCLRRDPAQRFASGDELREALEQLRPNQKAEALPEGNPYRGLLAFEAEHRGLFFGRKSEVGTILERLRTDPFVLVVADSGIGKSSLCRAGVLPHVTDGALGGGRTWTVRSMVPGKKPLAALCNELAPLIGLSEEALAAKLRTDPSELGRSLHKQLAADRGVVLFIDQLEEIVTIGAADEATVVAEALGYLCSRIHSVRMLMTVRSDFLARVAALPGLGEELARGLYLLRPLMPERIKEAITGPAATKGVHFENDELVDALANETARTDGGLPLLQFALTELWEVRQGSVITQRALDAIGGVSGALARHADQVMLSLPDEQRIEARRLLMALVTVEGTRARRSHDELVRTPVAAPALDALVKARLLVARDTGEGVSYEVAHEALLKGWEALRKWLDEHRESRAVRQRLEAAAAEWQRLTKHRDALWGPKQLAEVAILEAVDIGAREAQFLDASRHALRRKQQLRRALALLAPLAALLLYVGYQVKQRHDLREKVNIQLAESQKARQRAQQLSQELQIVRQQAFSAFDAAKRDEAEAIWAQVQEKTPEIDDLYALASQTLEAGLTLDPTRQDIKDRLADVLFDRAIAAENENNSTKVRDLLARMKLYDIEHKRQDKWNTPTEINLQINPNGAQVTAARYVETKRKSLELLPEQSIGSTHTHTKLSPGSYILTIRHPGYAVVRYPILAHRSESISVSFELPKLRDIPAGYIYIPPGAFLFGSDENDAFRKSFLGTAPIHKIWLPAYLISRNEVTFAEWIEYLNALPLPEREKRRQKSDSGAVSGRVELNLHPNGSWVLTIQPGSEVYTAVANEKISYKNRKIRQNVNWLRMPATGIAKSDAEEYAKWLNTSGRLPGARLCTEYEWERAGRGADSRDYPHGSVLLNDDANFDETYAKDPASVGLDEVGSHPVSESPFGLHDMAGNAFEWVTSSVDPSETVARGGSFFFGSPVLRLTNRSVVSPAFKEPSTGMRICISLTPSRT